MPFVLIFKSGNMMDRRCKQCELPLTGKREDAIFCVKRCRNKYNKRRQRILKRITCLKKQVADENDFIECKKQEVEKNELIEKENLPKLTERLKTFYEKRNKLEKNINTSFENVRRSYFKHIRENMSKESDEYLTLVFGNREEKNELVCAKYDDWRSMVRKLSDEIFDLREHIKELQRTYDRSMINELNNRIEKAYITIAELETELKEKEAIDLDNLPSQPLSSVRSITNRTSKGSYAQGFTGSQILEMNFEEVTLKGELGKFIGKLQRDKCAIALTGDSGVGKSTFSFHLAQLFLKRNLKVAYFALETGLSKKTQEMILSRELNTDKFKAFGEGKLEDVRYHARKFDCVVIDSYSKISSKPNDFEDLRQDFPNTFFVIIFQKTTDGKIRGGSSIIYNSTASIDLQMTDKGHRLAFMQKSRYDSENFVFSISNNKLLKSDKLPIKWSKIKEDWDDVKKS